MIGDEHIDRRGEGDRFQPAQSIFSDQFARPDVDWRLGTTGPVGSLASAGRLFAIEFPPMVLTIIPAIEVFLGANPCTGKQQRAACGYDSLNQVDWSLSEFVYRRFFILLQATFRHPD